jgi:hypothetical protein
MVRPQGFDHFCNHLTGLEEHYVIIGGGAASILMDDEGLEFRATKDVDLVVLTRSKELSQRIFLYVKDSGYNSKESTDKIPRYYRFKNPIKTECPQQIEIFSRNELGLELETHQHIIPISDSTSEKLSAILLDDEYFDLIRNNTTSSESGIPLISSLANICLKARAHRDLFDRKKAGDNFVDERDIHKHLKDIWRLAVTLTGSEILSLTGKPASDFRMAIEKLDKLSDLQFRQVMEKTPAKRSDIMGALNKVFTRGTK